LKLTVPETRIAKVGVQQVDIGQLSAGPLSVRRLVLDSVHVRVSTGAVRLRNVRVSVTLHLELKWEVSVDIPWVGSFGWDGTIDLGVHSIPVPLGNVSVPGLQSLSVDLASLSVNNVNAVIGAIHNLRLGPLVVEQIRANTVVAPTPGFQLAGLGLARAELDGVALPSATATGTTIRRVHGDAFPPGTVTISGLALPQASLGDISSQALDVDGTSNPLVLTADAGVLEVSLSVAPGARMEADELRLSNVRASTSVGSIELRDVVLPYDVLDIKLSQLGIETIEVPKIEVA
jgi:hypothetical protein